MLKILNGAELLCLSFFIPRFNQSILKKKIILVNIFICKIVEKVDLTFCKFCML